MIYYFIAGAAVLLAGVILGVAIVLAIIEKVEEDFSTALEDLGPAEDRDDWGKI